MAISTGLLKDVATGVIFIAVLLVAAAWFAGPGHLPRTGGRRSRHSCASARCPRLRSHVGLLAVLFIWDPIPATGTPAGILTFTGLALFGTYILMRQTASEFPEATSGAATQAIRARWTTARTPTGPAKHGGSRRSGEYRRATQAARRAARPR